MEQEDDDEAPPPDDKMIEAEPSHLDKHCHLLMDIEMHPPVLISSHFPDESTICFWHDQIENDDGFQQLVYHAIAKVRGLWSNTIKNDEALFHLKFAMYLLGQSKLQCEELS